MPDVTFRRNLSLKVKILELFKFDIWKDINSDDYEIRKTVQTQWETNFEIYAQKYDMIKPMLPSDFINTYEEYSSFHDMLIRQVYSFKNSIYIVLERKIHIVIKYTGIQSFNIDFSKQDVNFGLYSDGMSCWGYDEFSEDGHGLTHSILTDIGCEIKIEFKDISVRIYKNTIMNRRGYNYVFRRF